MELMQEILKIIFSNIIQIVVGFIITGFAQYLLIRSRIKINDGFNSGFFSIFIFTILGMLLPVNTYGLLPFSFILLPIGFKIYQLMPLLISNAMFNLTIPFTDITFVWRTGYRRIIFAFIIGFIAGLILKRIKINEEFIFKDKAIKKLFIMPDSPRNYFITLVISLKYFSVFLVTGAVIDKIFHKYIWWDLLHLLTQNPHTRFIPKFFAGYNVVNPLFLLAITTVYLIMDFVKMSAIISVFKIKSYIAYYAYFAVIAIMLGFSAFI